MRLQRGFWDLKQNKKIDGQRPGRVDLLRWVGWFSLLQGGLLSLSAFYYYQHFRMPQDSLAWMFALLSPLAHFAMVSALGALLLTALVLFLPQRRVVLAGGVGLYSGLALLLMVDMAVFARYRFHLNGMVWNLLTGGAGAEILGFSRVTLLWGLLAVLGLLLVQVSLGWGMYRRLVVKRGLKKAWLAVLFLVLAGQLLHGWADAVHHVPVTKQVRLLPGFKPLTMKRTMRKMGVAVAETRRGPLMDRRYSDLHYPLQPLSVSVPERPLNLLLIVIDGWRFDALTQEMTPNLKEFSRQSWRFDAHLSSANCTRFGIFGLFYGVYGTYWPAFLAEQRPPLLMEQLKKSGYSMGVFASANLASPEFDRTVFAGVRDRISLRQEGSSPAERDRTITDKMKAFLAEQDGSKPFFGFLFYDSPHGKDYPEEMTRFTPVWETVDYLALNNDFDPQPYYNRYRNAVFYVDSLISEVFATLETQGLTDSTIVAVVGDHGEEFNEYHLNYWGHNGNFGRYQTGTPLLLAMPGESPRVFTHRTSHLDVAPTLLRHMFRCNQPASTYSNGRDLTDISDRPYLFVNAWDRFGIVEQDKITVVYQSGETEALDSRSLQELPDGELDATMATQVAEGMGRFLAR
jgi:membrane-anchored protein YejM (alkaline phosphatase superfamily)